MSHKLKTNTLFQFAEIQGCGHNEQIAFAPIHEAQSLEQHVPPGERAWDSHNPSDPWLWCSHQPRDTPNRNNCSPCSSRQAVSTTGTLLQEQDRRDEELNDQ